MNETSITKRIMFALGCAMPNLRLFRNNTGMGWQGTRLQSRPGTVLLSDPRPLHAGLCEGSSDLIGWTSVEVTPEMVGRNVAVFTAIEVKQPRKRPSPAQANFLQKVREAGGITMVADDPVKSPTDLKNIAESLRR